jgi:hypothetical protein
MREPLVPVSFWFFETEPHFVAQIGIKLMIFLPQPPECWGYKCVLPHWLLIPPFKNKFKTKLFLVVVGFELKVLAGTLPFEPCCQTFIPKLCTHWPVLPGPYLPIYSQLEHSQSQYDLYGPQIPPLLIASVWT